MINKLKTDRSFYEKTEREEEAERHQRRAKRIRTGHDPKADLETANAPLLRKRPHRNARKPAEEERNHVEKPHRRRAELRRHHIEKRRMGVHLEKSAKDAVGRCGDKKPRERRRKSDQDKHRRTAKKRENLKAEPEARHPLHEVIGYDTARENGGECEQMVPEHHTLADLTHIKRK